MMKVDRYVWLTVVGVPLSLFLDPLLFGGVWQQYVVHSMIEALCFLCGVAIGRVGKASLE